MRTSSCAVVPVAELVSIAAVTDACRLPTENSGTTPAYTRPENRSFTYASFAFASRGDDRKRTHA